MKRAVLLLAGLGLSSLLLADPPYQAPFGTTPDWQSAIDYTAGVLAFADVDNDGDLDLAVGTYGGGYPPKSMHNVIFFNHQGVFEMSPTWTSQDETFTPDGIWADFNADGYQDLLAVNGGPEAFPSSIHYGSAEGLGKTAGWVSQTRVSSIFAAVGDVNNDGLLDFFTSNLSYNPQVTGVPGLGYVSENGILPTRYNWRSGYAIQGLGTTLADLDQDGLQPAEVTFPLSGKRSVFPLPPNTHRIVRVLVDGTAMHFLHVPENPWFAVPELRDHEGSTLTLQYLKSTDLDLVALEMNGKALIHLNDNGKIPAYPSFTLGEKHSNKMVRFIDIDNDGDLDMFIGGKTSPMRVHYTTNGTLDPLPFWYSKDPSAGMEDAVFGDVDNDGDLDLLTAHFTSKLGNYRLYVNRGGRLETEPEWILPYAGQSSTCVALADVNLDGRLDLAVGYGNGPIRLFLNRP
ncbi:MAG: hypothetical protein A2284_03860 [Deltaproteobacteria bacterium RIFOXYA12_FULL_61_11]|nr:MAG: hypothetical protein A2284_03860 [Deltaproteobacteria bacterium RIFOXYA12_FULL_61_11]